MIRVYLLSFIYCLSSLIVFAQEVEVLKKFKELESFSIPRDFKIIPNETQFMVDSKLAQLRSYCSHSEKSNVKDLYKRFRTEAFNMGANCFVIDSVNHGQGFDLTAVTISVYKLTEAVIETKQAGMNINMVYLLGALSIAEGDGRKIRVNGKVLRIIPLQILAYPIGFGEQIKINVGSFFGQTRRIVGKENMPPVYLSFGGFTASPVMQYGMIGGSVLTPALQFSTGRINVIDFDLGQFYVAVIGEELKKD